MNLAARLCSAAKPGQVLISEDTLKELDDGAVASPLPPIQVKGFDQPVGVHEVIQAEGRETARRHAGEPKP
jgi:adenylate cyclase